MMLIFLFIGFDRLEKKLGDEQLPLVSKFISALEHMSQPDQIFKVHVIKDDK